MEPEANSDPYVEFQYTDLPDDEPHIRLLKIKRADEGKSVECDLSTWQVSLAPPYNAISYVWGDPSSITTININGNGMTVRTNCDYVLRQASWYDCNQYIWVDAICINQNNFHEKGSQVARMGSIYAEARHVLACVGRHADDSEFFMREIRKNEGVYSSLSTAEVTKTHPGGSSEAHVEQKKSILSKVGSPGNRWLMRYSFSTSRAARLFRAHNKFFARSYFSRLWIVQEVFMGADVVLCCGPDTISFDSLDGHFRILRRSEEIANHTGPNRPVGTVYFGRLEGMLARPMCVRMMQNTAMKVSTITPSVVVRSRPEKREPFTFLDILQRVQDLKCENPLDKVYGILSLIDFNKETMVDMYPDYELSGYQLALNLLSKDWAGDPDYSSLMPRRARILVENFGLREEQLQMQLLSADMAIPRSSLNASRPEHKTFRHQTWSQAFTLIRDDGDFHHQTDIMPSMKTSNVQPGDWVIFPDFYGDISRRNHPFGPMDSCILGRPNGEDHLDLISFTAFSKEPESYGITEMVSLFLNPEDLLLLVIQDECLQRLSREPENEGQHRKFLDLLSRNVCQYPGSSYAELTDRVDAKRLLGFNSDAAVVAEEQRRLMET